MAHLTHMFNGCGVLSRIFTRVAAFFFACWVSYVFHARSWVKRNKDVCDGMAALKEISISSLHSLIVPPGGKEVLLRAKVLAPLISAS